MGRSRSRRRRGKSGGVGSGGSKSKSNKSKSKSKRRSTAASKRRKVRSVAKAKRAAARAAKSSTSTSSSTSSSKTKRKPRKIKLNKKDRQRQAGENVKKAFKKKHEQQKQHKKNTISASQSRRQVRQKTKEKIATRKKINMPNLSQIGRLTRNLRQPVTALSNMAINSVVGNPSFATNLLSPVANSRFVSDYNKTDALDRSKMTPQQIRHKERMMKKTGIDYFAPRKELGRINLSADSLAGLGKFKNSNWYTGLPKRFPGIKNIRINKTFYGRPRVKGLHSSQRTGRGQGLRSATEAIIGGQQQRQAAEALAQQQNQAAERQYDFDRQAYDANRGPQRPTQPAMGPQQDWLGSLYRRHNINQGNLDKGARAYWSNEAKTKGRDAVMQSIIGTSKAQGTYGGRKKPQRINRRYGFGTPRVHRDNKGSRRTAGGGPIGAALSAGLSLFGSSSRARRAKRKAKKQNQATQRQYQYDSKAYNKKKRKLAKSLAAHAAEVRGI